MPARSWRRALVRSSLALLAASALAAIVWFTQKPPEGPQPVIWDKESCAECQMAVSERGYAAQLQTADGRVLDFDDPGCLASYLAKSAPEVKAIYFHHLREDRWLPLAGAAFVPAGPSPMAYDLGAVDPGSPGSCPWSEARVRLLTRQADGGGR